MNIIEPVYFVQSESGHHMGYVMTLEIAKIIGNNKPPPDEQEYAANRSYKTSNTNGRQVDSAS